MGHKGGVTTDDGEQFDFEVFYSDNKSDIFLRKAVITHKDGRVTQLSYNASEPIGERRIFIRHLESIGWIKKSS